MFSQEVIWSAEIYSVLHKYHGLEIYFEDEN